IISFGRFFNDSWQDIGIIILFWRNIFNWSCNNRYIEIFWTLVFLYNKFCRIYT
ncbi:hypothetical protein CLU79DRAFT_738143, partial [Phycomyces nitens]